MLTQVVLFALPFKARFIVLLRTELFLFCAFIALPPFLFAQGNVIKDISCYQQGKKKCIFYYTKKHKIRQIILKYNYLIEYSINLLEYNTACMFIDQISFVKILLGEKNGY